jgi:hypothetical protein
MRKLPLRAFRSLWLAPLLACACASWQLPPGFGSPRAPTTPPLVTQPASQLPAPEGLRAGSGEYRAIPLKWDPVLAGEVGGYRIEHAQQREGPYLPLVPIWGRGVIAHVDASPGDATTRFYRIRTFSRDGHLSQNVSGVVVGTTAALPGPPKGLRAYSRQPREVPLAWRASVDPLVAGYRVERSPSPDGPFEAVAELAGRHATAYVDRELGDLRVFFYRVKALNPAGASGAPSESVRAVTKPEPLPPLGLRVESQRLGINVLAWEPNVERDLAEYRLYRIDSALPTQLVGSVSADHTVTEDRTVASGESVTYALVALDRDGLESRPSEPVQASGERYGLSAEALPDGVHLRWDPRPAEGFVQARIERFSWLRRRVLGASDDGHFIDREALPGASYRYVVVLERAGDDPAPASQPIAVRIPDPGDSN